MPIYTFFNQTIRDWNELPDSLISSAELLDECVSKFIFQFYAYSITSDCVLSDYSRPIKLVI